MTRLVNGEAVAVKIASDVSRLNHRSRGLKSCGSKMQFFLPEIEKYFKIY